MAEYILLPGEPRSMLEIGIGEMNLFVSIDTPVGKRWQLDSSCSIGYPALHALRKIASISNKMPSPQADKENPNA